MRRYRDYKVLDSKRENCYNSFMSNAHNPDHLAILTNYSQGQAGTRDTIVRLGLRDYSDLLIALGKYDLPLPKPVMTSALVAHDAQAAAILMPRLQHGN